MLALRPMFAYTPGVFSGFLAVEYGVAPLSQPAADSSPSGGGGTAEP